ncbi:MAG TPA: UDP-N-acetylmuramoyl-L-alanyl-D-glutamate--2,6-diaminopimelate ligase [Ilumatobacter sp.]|nr:UDP-N-acetylmuramoyl-L-alanyl-D-glutamate--2,6-diaminopimelate ligase [Ilumatobacter sp.]
MNAAAPYIVETLPADVVDLTHDSRQVAPGWAFACVVGAHADGHDYAAAAVAAGATALVAERPLPTDLVGGVAQLIVPDTRAAMGSLAAAVHGRPATKLTMVGITGTNGKTTTSHLLAAILRHAGTDTRLIGTLSGTRTTPEAPDLQRLLAGYVSEGVGAVVMEVSSHALALHRVRGAHFDVAVFTNLSRDHLDLHASMEEYFRAKAQLFTPGLSSVAVVNTDDPHGRLLFDAAPIPTTAFAGADATDVEVRADRVAFTWRGLPVTLPIGGRFNVANALAALTAAEQLGVAPSDAAAGLATCPPVPGRFETVSAPGAPFAVVVDYAHTPDGLVEVLASAREVVSTSAGRAGNGRVIVVFGCGGDRDPDKRPLMGAAAGAHADVVVVTSDNPRTEDPLAIIDAAAAGVRAAGADPLIEPDRRAAIALALATARAGDVVVVAGKGHEPYQTIGSTNHPFDDRAVARELLKDLHS